MRKLLRCSSIKLNALYNEDCMLTMSKMPSNFVDIIITSPPYNKAGYEGFLRKTHPRDAWQAKRNIDYSGDAKRDFMPEAEYEQWQIDVLNEFHRVLKPDGSIFYNHKVRVAQHKGSHPIEWILKSKNIFRQQIIWDRGSNTNVAPIRYIPSTELLFWLTKQRIQPNFSRVKTTLFQHEVWRINPVIGSEHPAPFPEELPRNILTNIKNKSNVVVYDAFCGTGTTLKVAKEFGMNYIGSEISKEYCKMAERRLSKCK